MIMLNRLDHSVSAGICSSILRKAHRISGCGIDQHILADKIAAKPIKDYQVIVMTQFHSRTFRMHGFFFTLNHLFFDFLIASKCP